MSGLVARLRRHFGKRTLGQSIVEFAIILPLFLLFLAAALDLGRVFYATITLNNAAREGAFQAAKTPDLYLDGQPCDQATNRVVCRVQNESAGSMIEIQPADIDMSCNMTGCPKAAGSFVTVDVHGAFSLVTPLLASFFGGQDIELTSTAMAQIEYLPNPNTLTPPPGPVAAFTASDYTIMEGETVDFDSTGSTGDPTGWQWDFDGDAYVDSTDQNPQNVLFSTAGTYTVTLTIVNLSGVSSVQHTVTVSGPTPEPGATVTPAPTPACVYPPNVIGVKPFNATDAMSNAGFTNVNLYDDLTSGPVNKIQAQDPDHTQCIALTTNIRLHYRGGH
jgi:PKD repeat protein